MTPAITIKADTATCSLIYTADPETDMSRVTRGGKVEASGAGEVRVTHGSAGRPPSRAVAEAVAELVGVEPAELAAEAGIVLYDYVDSDALVGKRAESAVDVSLTVADYEVSVDATAAVARPS